jgi:hypothetical protein
VISAGSAMLVKYAQFKKALRPMLVSEDGSEILVNFVL